MYYKKILLVLSIATLSLSGCKKSEPIDQPTTIAAIETTVAETTAAAETTTEPDALAAATADRNLKMMSGELGKGVVALTDAQIEDLLERLGLEMFDFYVDKLSTFIIKNGARVKSHYDTILRWYREDSAANI